ncbi:MAG: lytic transglycosylase domain-containing protein [Oscillospiraceae bacterium]|jgi:soluble lytic murein transglycosylase|nr:lytic transglycosylase domain-containing protein [Oscillospiraceae bacterium]
MTTNDTVKKNSPLKKLLFACGLTFLILATVLVIAINPILKTTMPLDYQRLVQKYAKEYNLDEALVFAVIKTESSFNPNAVSGADARGLMQITPDTFEWLQTKTGERHELQKLFDPETCIRYGTFFLSILINEFKNVDTALAAYNAGRTRVNTWLQDDTLTDDGVTLKYIPFPETRYYVKKINTALEWYRKLYDFTIAETELYSAKTTVSAEK